MNARGRRTQRRLWLGWTRRWTAPGEWRLDLKPGSPAVLEGTWTRIEGKVT